MAEFAISDRTRLKPRPFSFGTGLSTVRRMRLDGGTIERIEDALREISVLFIALARLDVFLGDDRVDAVRNGLIFVAAGIILFVLALRMERTRSHG